MRSDLPTVRVERDGTTWRVVTEDEAVLGRVERVPAALANLGKSKTKPTFNAHGHLWNATPEGAGLEPDDERAVARAVVRQKTTKQTAADHLLAAYAAAGVALPDPPQPPDAAAASA